MSETKSLFECVRWHWCFGRLRTWKCWARLGHAWRQNAWPPDKDGEVFVEEACSRCGVERHSFALLVFWGTPLVWRLSFRVKHGKWPSSKVAGDA